MGVSPKSSNDAEVRPRLLAYSHRSSAATFRTADHVVSTNASYAEIALRRGDKRPADVTVVRTKRYAQAKVEGVPPEEFGIARGARSLRDCNYCFHDVIRTESALIAQGFDAGQVRGLTSYTGQAEI